MMGAEGLTLASQIAILNANYMVKVLEDHFPVLYHGLNGRVAHEFIIDLRPFRKTSGITEEDARALFQPFDASCRRPRHLR